ncbi:NADH-quinone oxidoreductase subunit J [Streptomyces sp. NPDC006134]|uniref:NADH-quinone oxidoreductase subunit J n=1 Tax=Streptomyces sp. NPDC006134 TaxID=3154467 RepID=UPI0033F7DC6D
MTLAATVGGLAAPLAAESHGFLSPTGVEIAFLLVGLVTFGAAIVTVTTKQLVHAALWLVVALGGLAVEYLLLTAEFIAWVQVLIYVGSVVVLLLFGLMLTRAPIGRSPDADSGNRWAALTVAVAAAAALVWVVVDAFRTTWIDLDGPAAGSTQVTGASLFQNWVLPFEALSVLLLAALVGAIVLSRKAKADASGTATSPAGTATSPAGTAANPTGVRGDTPDTPHTASTPRTAPTAPTAGTAGTAPTAGTRGSADREDSRPGTADTPGQTGDKDGDR